MWMNMTKLRKLLLLLLIWDGVYGALVILQLCGIRLSRWRFLREQLEMILRVKKTVQQWKW